MLAVIKIYEETFEVGQAVSAASWEDAYKKAHDFIYEELEARAVKDPGDLLIAAMISDIIKGNNYFLFSADGGNWDQNCEQGKAVAIQIIEIE